MSSSKDSPPSMPAAAAAPPTRTGASNPEPTSHPVKEAAEKIIAALTMPALMIYLIGKCLGPLIDWMEDDVLQGYGLLPFCLVWTVAIWTIPWQHVPGYPSCASAWWYRLCVNIVVLIVVRAVGWYLS